MSVGSIFGKESLLILIVVESSGHHVRISDRNGCATPVARYQLHTVAERRHTLAQHVSAGLTRQESSESRRDDTQSFLTPWQLRIVYSVVIFLASAQLPEFRCLPTVGPG